MSRARSALEAATAGLVEGHNELTLPLETAPLKLRGSLKHLQMVMSTFQVGSRVSWRQEYLFIVLSEPAVDGILHRK